MSKNITIKNQLRLIAFCALIGATAGVVVWVMLKIMALGIDLLWDWIPQHHSLSWYPVIVCTLGAALIGVFRKKYGDYPEELETVLHKVRQDKKYEYRNMLIMMIAALLPLLFGSSVGPEAGLTGIIVGLCYWAGDNLKFAKQNTSDYSQIGIAVSLSVLFHAPLFGIFEVEEDANVNLSKLSSGSRIFIYGIALVAGTGTYAGLSALFGAGLSGFPSFAMQTIHAIDYVLILLYILCGFLLALFYHGMHHTTKQIAKKIPPILREIIAGLSLGLLGMLVPAVMFSGEEQMSVLMKDYASYLPLALIGLAFLKIFLTNLCIQFGLKGGHFFPVIFAGVCMGYGIAMLLCGTAGDHVVFAAAVVTAALLGAIMQKPLAVTMLLFLCFPIKLFVWIFVAATAGSKMMGLLRTA